MKKIIVILAAAFLACEEKKPGVEIPEPEPEGRYELVNMERVFGFYGQSRYSYCPSVVKEPNGATHLFFCGNPEQQIMVDNIYHIRINPDGSQTEAKSVLQPGISGSWDDHHICDPSVIEGKFRMNGKEYRYAMFYLTNAYNVYYNEVGVAFSNELEADSWEKYPQQLVKKTWGHDGDEPLPGGGKSWGTGQPSAVSLDKNGKVLLTYTIGDISGTRIEWVELDLSDMDKYMARPSARMVDEGLINIGYTGKDYTCNSDFAIDQQNDVIVMVRPVQPHPATYPAYLNESLEVNYMPLSGFLNRTGKWESIIRIAPYMTGFPRNHNAGLERNSYGEIADWKKPVVYYTVSKAAPDVSPGGTTHAEWTYHIYRGEVVKK
ncbi:sugar-binding protein [Leadbetterella sp. DM7]|uniref:sugar-binding protein n=1 Tax=Leadbetterella sp. DM7 TaxID=3235085 RepID=UPI00349E7AA5